MFLGIGLGLTAGGVAATGPAIIAGLQAWFRGDAATAATLTDLSGNGNAATQGTAGKQASISAGGLGSQPRIVFAGAQGYTTPLDLAGAHTVFAVFKVNGTDTSGYTVWRVSHVSGGNAVSDGECVINVAGYQSVSYRGDYLASGGSVGCNPTLGTTSGHCLVQTYNGGTNTAAGSYTADLDGVAQTITTSGAFAGSASDRSSLGARVSSADAVSLGAKLDLYEWAAWGRVLTTTERAALYTYAHGRYGV